MATVAVASTVDTEVTAAVAVMVLTFVAMGVGAVVVLPVSEKPQLQAARYAAASSQDVAKAGTALGLTVNWRCGRPRGGRPAAGV